MKLQTTYSIPGGWYGNDTNCSGQVGNVAVDPKKVVDAILWLRRRAYILATDIINGGVDAAINIQYQQK